MPILYSMPLDVLKTLMFKYVESTLKYGQILYEIGAKPPKLYLIVSGAVTLYEFEQMPSSESGGQPKIQKPKLVAVSHRIDKQSVGEEVFLTRKPARHRAVCTEDGTLVLSVDHEQLRRFLGTKERLRFESNCLNIINNHNFLAEKILAIKATVANKIAKEKEEMITGKSQDNSKAGLLAPKHSNRLSLDAQKKQLISECNDLIQKFVPKQSPSLAGRSTEKIQKNQKKTLSIEVFHTSHRAISAQNTTRNLSPDPFEDIKLITMNTLNKLTKASRSNLGNRRTSLNFCIKTSPMVSVEVSHSNPKPFFLRSQRTSAPECRSAFEGVQPDPAGLTKPETSHSFHRPLWTRSPSLLKKEQEDSLATALSRKTHKRFVITQSLQYTPTSLTLGGFFHRRTTSGLSHQKSRKQNPSLRFDA